MAVYKRGYRRYEGPICSRWSRLLVLPRFTWNHLFQKRLVIILLAISMIWPLLCALYLYIGNNLDLLKGAGVGASFLGFIKGDAQFFLVFMNVQAVFAVFMAALAGPGCISSDLANNALPLYFSRPINRLEYAAGRMSALLGLLSLMTWIPGAILFAMQWSMAGNNWFSENWQVAPALFAGLLLWIFLVAFVSLTSASYVRMRIVAGGLVLGFFFILSGASVIVRQVFRSDWGYVLNPSWSTRRIWYSLLSLDPPEGPGALACMMVIAFLFLLLVFVLERKLRPVEVIS